MRVHPGSSRKVVRRSLDGIDGAEVLTQVQHLKGIFTRICDEQALAVVVPATAKPVGILKAASAVVELSAAPGARNEGQCPKGRVENEYLIRNILHLRNQAEVAGTICAHVNDR